MKCVGMNEVECVEYDAARDISEDEGNGYEIDHEMIFLMVWLGWMLAMLVGSSSL